MSSSPATTRQSKAKMELSHKVWDTIPHKLILYIMDAQNVAAKDSNGKSDPFVVIEHGQYKKQTKVQDKTLNPVWNELFFIQADPNVEIKLEMWDHDVIGSPDYMGHVMINLKTVPEDRVIDLYPTLQPRGKKKEVISGQIHVRLYHSSAKETRNEKEVINKDMQFAYKPFKSAFKPGDLIAYSGHGIISGLQKVLTGNPFTSVGMVLFLPNKWTGDVEPYVVELTRNVTRNMDAFMDSNAKSGIYIFRLYERFHHFHGSNVVHFPLKHPLPADMYKKIVEKVWEWHKRNGFLNGEQDNYHFGSYYTPLTTFIKHKKNWIFAKNEKLVEASSFDFVCRLLKLSGALDMAFSDPAEILKSHLYCPPLLIRQVPGEAPLFFNGVPVIAPVPTQPLSVQAPHPPTPQAVPPYEPARNSVTLSQPIPSYVPETARNSVTLSQLEFNLLLGLVDGLIVDNKVVVTKAEFRQKMIEKGVEAFKDERKFEAFYSALDADNDGRVDVRELVVGFAVLLEGSADEKLLTAFKVFDRDGDNFISRSELRMLLAALLRAASAGGNNSADANMVDEFVQQIFTEFDKNHDGRLSVDEFLSAAHNNSAVGNLFLLVSSAVVFA